MGQHTPYTYEPIKANQVRLLQFLDDGNEPSVIVKTFSLGDPIPPYHALSYTWASSNKSHAKTWAIIIDGKAMPLLDSLQSFVNTLRSNDILLDGRWWWIDSICIDLENLEERAQQVRLMQQIYQQAGQVIVWLGEQSADSDLAFDFIELLHKIKCERYAMSEVRMMLEGNQYQDHWNALTNILARGWWSRIWTIQEFVLAASASFWCGGRAVSRHAMCSALWAADKCTSTATKETRGFRYANNRKRVWELYAAGEHKSTNPTLSLLALASYFSSMDATRERDRLYGLMALATDSFLLDIDYSCTSQQAYLHFAQSFITHHKSLDIICFASVHSPPPESSRPSWVPDWRKGDEYLVTPLMVSQSSRTHIGNCRPVKALGVDNTVSYSASGNTAAVFKFQGSTLVTQGMVIDVVDGLAGSKSSGMTQSSELKSRTSRGHTKATYSSLETLMSVCRSLVLDRYDRYLGYPMPAEEFFQDFMYFCNILLTTKSDRTAPQEIQDWFNRTKSLVVHGHSLENILQDSHQLDASSGRIPNEDEYISSTFFGRFFDVVVRMSLQLITSRDRRIGMVSENARKGDLICVLFGCSVPILLRQSGDGNTFQFISECYLDGFMHGEALEQCDLLERSFCIA